MARGRRGTTSKESDDLLQLSNLMQLSDVQIHANKYVFAAVKTDGGVVAWGDAGQLDKAKALASYFYEISRTSQKRFFSVST